MITARNQKRLLEKLNSKKKNNKFTHVIGDNKLKPFFYIKSGKTEFNYK